MTSRTRLAHLGIGFVFGIGLFGAGCGSGDGDGDGTRRDASVDPDAGSTVDAPNFGDPLVGRGQVELVQGGFMFTEGPQWREAQGELVFSDVPGNTIYRYPAGGPAVTLKSPSNNANGLAVDGSGALIAAEHGQRRVSRDGTAIASMFEGKRLNSPNDVIVADDGTIYFTDPPYGILPMASEIGFMGVFRIAPGGALTVERRGGLAERPNGIGLSPDGKTLYVADTDDGTLYKFAVQADGALGPRQPLVATSGNPDGLAIDIAGNIFVATSAGIDAYDPTGKLWGVIPVPLQPANCAFGDRDHKTLYITARNAVYRVQLAHPGLPRR